MTKKRKRIDRAGQLAVAKHQRLLHHKVLELVLGDMIAASSVHEVREKLMWYYDHLSEFDNG